MNLGRENIAEDVQPALVLRCRLCGEPLREGGRLSLEQLPVCNRFTRSREPEERHGLRLDQCARCRLIQLCEPLPVDAITPRLSWIKYREPEGHLDSVVERLISELCPKASSSFGVGPFDKPLLDRLRHRGLSSSTLEMCPSQSGEGFPYLETWQLGLNPANLAEVTTARGRADVVSCRYLLEHCDDPLGALRGLRQLVSADGVLIVEVPDSSKFLGARDYSFIWEEHVTYFVEDTFRLLAVTAGFTVVDLLRYPGDLEDALVAVLRPSAGRSDARVEAPSADSDLFGPYASDLQPTREFVRSWFSDAAGPKRDGVALFGIGHQAVMFVNAFDLSEYVAAAVDDDPNKSGYFPPGFGVPVIPSPALLQDNRIRTCLFAVAPGIEHKIRHKLAPLAKRGVRFGSIFAGAPGSILSGRSSWH
jgi:hypothetical protein